MASDSASTAPEGGFTLIEVLVTLSIVSIAFVAILSAISVMIVSSAEHRELTDAEAAVRNAAEFVRNEADVPYQPCGAAPAPQAAYDGMVVAADDAELAVASGYAVGVAAVEPWNGDADPATFAAAGTCPAGGDRGVQRVTVRVTTPSGSTQDLLVVKREP
jgi:prepilin-type N-terminal cleavage/methylation domain-containing protein